MMSKAKKILSILIFLSFAFALFGRGNTFVSSGRGISFEDALENGKQNAVLDYMESRFQNKTISANFPVINSRIFSRIDHFILSYDVVYKDSLNNVFTIGLESFIDEDRLYAEASTYLTEEKPGGSLGMLYVVCRINPGGLMDEAENTSLEQYYMQELKAMFEDYGFGVEFSGQSGQNIDMAFGKGCDFLAELSINLNNSNNSQYKFVSVQRGIRIYDVISGQMVLEHELESKSYSEYDAFSAYKNTFNLDLSGLAKIINSKLAPYVEESSGKAKELACIINQRNIDEFEINIVKNELSVLKNIQVFRVIKEERDYARCLMLFTGPLSDVIEGISSSVSNLQDVVPGENRTLIIKRRNR